MPLAFVLGAVLVIGLRTGMGFETAGFDALVPGSDDFFAFGHDELQVLITVWTIVVPLAFLAALGASTTGRTGSRGGRRGRRTTRVTARAAGRTTSASTPTTR